MVEEARREGPLLLLDAGNALFKAPGLDDPASRAKAELIVDSMARLGTFAMAVGNKDLVAGRAFLEGVSRKAGLKLLSANLRGAEGKLLFAPSAVAVVGDLRVGVIGVSPPGPSKVGEPWAGAPVQKSVLEEAARLRRKVDLVVVLAAVPYADALQLAQESKAAVDLVLQSNEGRGMGVLQKVGDAWLVPTGERGRAIGRLDVGLDGSGALIDLGEVDRNRQTAKLLQSQVQEVDRRLAAAKEPDVRRSLQEARAGFEARRREVERSISAAAPGRGRTLQLSWRHLGEDVKDDPGLKAQVEKLEPPGTAH